MQTRALRSFSLAVLLLALALPALAGFVTIATGAGSKWDDRNHGTPAVVSWGFMDPGTLVDSTHPLFAEVVGGSDIAAMRANYDGTHGAGAFDAALGRAFETWAAVSGIDFVGPVADGGGNVGAAGATDPDIRVGAFLPVAATPFAGLGGVGYGPPGDDIGFPDPVAGDILFNLSQPAIQPAGNEDDPIVGIGNDLENLFLHELGHAAMGLGHPASGPGDVMYVGVNCCNLINRELSADDITGAQVVYGPPACDDGIDNDGDGAIDLADAGCDQAFDSKETSDALLCDNGIDDDLDGWIDFSGGDPGCSTATYFSESPQCQDGVNNDNATGTDFDGGESIFGVGNGDPNGPDPQCNSFADNREAPNPPGPCGLGPELLLLFPLLWSLRRRRR